MRKFIVTLLLICGCGHARVTDEHRVALPIDQVPEKVLKVAQQKFRGVKFDTAWKFDTGVIEMRGKNKTGKIHAVELSPTGKIVEAD